MFTSMTLGGALVLAMDIVAIASLMMGRSSVGHRVLWIFLILFMPCLGVILYFLFGRKGSDA